MAHIPALTLRRKNRLQALALALIGLGLLALGALALVLLPRQAEPGREASAVPASVNYPAPALTLTDLQGQARSLSDYRGQVALVNNWTTWCPPCREEMPALQAYYEAHRGEGFTILAIDAGETAGEVRRFVEAYGLTFPVWLDPQQDALLAFKNLALPSSYVIDQEGTVRLAWSGAISAKMLEKYVTPLLSD